MADAATFSAFMRAMDDHNHPVGSIVTLDTDENPAKLYGGTWEEVKNAVLRGAGAVRAGTYTGSDSVALKEANLPNHRHSVPAHAHSLPSHSHSMSHTHGVQHSSGDWRFLVANDDVVSRRRVHVGLAGNHAFTFTSDNPDEMGGMEFHRQTAAPSATATGRGGSGSTGSAGGGHTGYAGSGVAFSTVPRSYTVRHWRRIA